jgi:uncharacterized protein YbjQ (UPF0145 family)
MTNTIDGHKIKQYVGMVYGEHYRHYGGTFRRL